MSQLKDKVVVVTGASKGLGKTLAKMLTAKGNAVVICSRGKEEIVQTAEEVGAVAFAADVTKESDVVALKDFALSEYGRIDVWINNAGVWIPHAPIEELDLARVKEMFDVNVYGLVSGSKAALIEMRKQGSGMIVNIVSSSALTGRPFASAYAASKWAARGFTDSLREECRDSRIQVIGVYPGGIKTHLFDEKPPEEVVDYMEVDSVAEKIITNLEEDEPLEEQILRRPNA